MTGRTSKETAHRSWQDVVSTPCLAHWEKLPITQGLITEADQSALLPLLPSVMQRLNDWTEAKAEAIGSEDGSIEIDVDGVLCRLREAKHPPASPEEWTDLVGNCCAAWANAHFDEGEPDPSMYPVVIEGMKEWYGELLHNLAAYPMMGRCSPSDLLFYMVQNKARMVGSSLADLAPLALVGAGWRAVEDAS